MTNPQKVDPNLRIFYTSAYLHLAQICELKEIKLVVELEAESAETGDGAVLFGRTMGSRD